MVVPRERTTALLEAVVAHLADDDRARLTAALPWRPRVDAQRLLVNAELATDARGIAGLAPELSESPDAWCLSFTHRADAPLLAYVSDRLAGQDVPPVPGALVRIGCVWTTLRAGEKLTVLQGVAATSAMSRLFAESTSVQATWIDIANRAGALQLFFDTEEDSFWEVVTPARRRVPLPSHEDITFDEDYEISVDDFYQRAFAAL